MNKEFLTLEEAFKLFFKKKKCMIKDYYNAMYWKTEN